MPILAMQLIFMNESSRSILWPGQGPHTAPVKCARGAQHPSAEIIL
jgi:hypothetical protein